MFHTMINAVAGFGRAKLQNIILAGAALVCIPTATFARHPNFHVDVVVPPPVVYVDPACQPTRQWVEPVYQTVTEQVWVPAVTRTEIQRVEVPAEYAWRDVVSYDFFGHPHRFRQQVLISPAHCEDRQWMSLFARPTMKCKPISNWFAKVIGKRLPPQWPSFGPVCKLKSRFLFECGVD